MKSILKQYRHAILFVVVFIGLYLVLNTAYGFWVNSFTPDADPVTLSVTRQVGILLSFFHDNITVIPEPGSPYIPLLLSGVPIVNVYEGCNGLNVMIVYVAFLCAYRSSLKRTLLFVLAGLAAIHLFNLLRVALLFEVALLFPERLYFFHKYLFTGFIYGVVFLLWFFWIKYVREDK